MQFASSQHLDANEEDLEGSDAKSTEAIMSSGLKDFSLLAAAQREISKLKEVCSFWRAPLLPQHMEDNNWSWNIYGICTFSQIFSRQDLQELCYRSEIVWVTLFYLLTPVLTLNPRMLRGEHRCTMKCMLKVWIDLGFQMEVVEFEYWVQHLYRWNQNYYHNLMNNNFRII